QCYAAAWRLSSAVAIRGVVCVARDHAGTRGAHSCVQRGSGQRVVTKETRSVRSPGETREPKSWCLPGGPQSRWPGLTGEKKGAEAPCYFLSATPSCRGIRFS